MAWPGGPGVHPRSDRCAALDRNGLRPCRYTVTRDHLVVACSEVGVADLDPAEVVESSGLGPGDLLIVDTARGWILRSAEAKRAVARRRPHSRWVARRVHPLGASPASQVPPP